MTTDALPPIVERLLREYLAAPNWGDPWERSDAARLRALPIGRGPDSSHYLRPCGEVVIVDRDGSESTTREYRWVLAAIVWGTDRYPDLTSLIPTRPPDARDCHFCGGAGRWRGQQICPKCGGLGWETCGCPGK